MGFLKILFKQKTKINQKTSDSLNNSREIRVFISSTFRDMEGEREVLVKKIFPQIRKLCESRNVTCTEIDLRWGITQKQASDGKVLPICLAEIKRCKPYFIGILGERYGWVPDEIDKHTSKQEPWLLEHRQKSVTELEILHGVFNQPDMASRAFFYFRDPGYIDLIADDKKICFLESPTQNEIVRFGSQEAARRVKMRKKKLNALKERIRNSGFPLRENYPDPNTLGELVFQDLTEVISTDFPQEKKLGKLALNATEHHAFAKSRLGVYIGRDEYIEALDRLAVGDGPPLSVLGDSGAGKTALLANWIEHYSAIHPDDFIISHFIGSTSQSTNWDAMLRRFMGEFKKRFNIDRDIPEKPYQMRSSFANWLHIVSGKGIKQGVRIILVIDAVNQLEDRDGAIDLAWLPLSLPPNVRIILSTLPGRPLNEIKKRGWPCLTIKPLEVSERRQLIKACLIRYTKQLNSEQIRRIQDSDQSANPLYLRALLEELRVFGSHEQLDHQISYYLEADSVSNLYQLILARYEADYDDARPGLVQDTMTLIWASRRGLSEAELIDLLGGEPGKPLPAAKWSPFFLAAEQLFIHSGGRLSFFHDHIRQAVTKRYLPGRKQKHAAHERLIRYFNSSPFEERQMAELPWQLAVTGSWQRLSKLLSNPPYLGRAWKYSFFDVLTYWTHIQRFSDITAVEAYQNIINDPGKHNKYAQSVAELLVSLGDSLHALPLLNFTVSQTLKLGNDTRNPNDIVNRFSQLISALRHTGQLDLSMKYCIRLEDWSRQTNHNWGLHYGLWGQGAVLRLKGDLDNAKRLLEEALAICHLNKFNPTSVILELSSVYFDKGKFDKAIYLLHQAEQICIGNGDQEGLSTCLGNQSIILRNSGNIDKALELSIHQEAICRNLGNHRQQAQCLGSQALIYKQMGAVDEALRRIKEQQSLFHKLKDETGLVNSYINEANVLRRLGKSAQAETVFEIAEKMAREGRSHQQLAFCLINRSALLAQDLKQPEEAYYMARESLHICRKFGLKRLEDNVNQLISSLPVLAEKVTSSEKDGSETIPGSSPIKNTSSNQKKMGFVHHTMTDIEKSIYDNGMSWLLDQPVIKSGVHAPILSEGAAKAMADGDLDEASDLYKDLRNLGLKTGDETMRAVGIIGLANCCHKKGKLEKSLALFKEAEQVLKKTSDIPHLANCLFNQSLVLMNLGRSAESMPLCLRAEQLAEQNDLVELSAQIKRYMKQIQSRMGW